MFLLKLLAGVSVLVVLLLANLADGKALPGSSPSSIKTLDQSAATLPLLTSSMTRSQSAKTGAAEGSEESSEEEEEEEEEGEGEEEEEETKKEEEGEVEKKEEETKVKGEKEKSAGESPKDEVTKLQEESQPTDKKEEIGEESARPVEEEKPKELAQLPIASDVSIKLPEVWNWEPHQKKAVHHSTTRRPSASPASHQYWAQPKRVDDDIEAELWAKSPTSFHQRAPKSNSSPPKSTQRGPIITPASTFKLNSVPLPYFHAFRPRM